MLENGVNLLAATLEVPSSIIRHSGEVIGLETLTDTSFNISGGGGSLNEYGGKIQSISGSSSTSHRQTVFLKNEAGLEETFEIDPVEIKVRQGHFLSIIEGEVKRTAQKHRLVIYNHDTKTSWTNPEGFDAMITEGALLLKLFGIFCLVLLGLYFGPFNFGFLYTILGVIIFGFVLSEIFKTKHTNAIEAFQNSEEWTSYLDAIANLK